MSADGKRILSGGGDPFFSGKPREVKVWDAETGQEARTLHGHTDRVSSVAISADGKRIVSGSDDTTVKVWDAETGQDIRTLKGHTFPVNSVAMSADGKRILSEDTRGKMLCWEVESGHLIVDPSARMPDGPARTAFADGRFLRIDGNTISLIDPRRLEREEEINRQRLAKWAAFHPAFHRSRLQQAEDSKDTFAAVFHLKRLVAAYPHDAALHIQLAHAHADEKRPAQTITHLMHALFLQPRVSLYPADPNAAQRAEQSAQAGDCPLAVRILHRAVHQPGAPAVMWGQLLLAQLATGQHQEAQDTLAQIAGLLSTLAEKESRQPLLVATGVAIWDPTVGKRLQAQTQRELERERTPFSLHLHGTALFRNGHLDEAEKHFAASVQLHGKGGQIDTRAFQALIARQRGRLDEAERLLVVIEAELAKIPSQDWVFRLWWKLLLAEARRPLPMTRAEMKE